MTTFNADGSKTDAPEQLQPPADLMVPSTDESEADRTEMQADVSRADYIEKAIAEAATDDDPEDVEVGVVYTTSGVGGPAKDVEVVDAEPVEESTSTAVALADRFDVTKAGEAWPYDMLEFKGDLLGIRLPDRKALAAFSLASSKYVSLGVKNDLTGLFIARHLSPESYGRVFSRLMDPDEDDYDVDTVGELFNAIVTAAVDADKASGDDAKK